METSYWRNAKAGRVVRLDVEPDSNPMNPLTDTDAWEDLRIACTHPRYVLGRTGHYSPHDIECLRHTLNESEGKTTLACVLEIYDHGGVTMRINAWGVDPGSTACPWDSSVVGVAWVELASFGFDEEKARKYIRAAIGEYDDYLRGAVYGYTATDLGSYEYRLNGTPMMVYRDDFDPSTEDSCWGFYGYDGWESGLLENALGRREDWEELTEAEVEDLKGKEIVKDGKL